VQVKTEYRRCMRNLKFHKLAFEKALEESLLPLIVDEDTISTMLEDSFGELRKDPRMTEIERKNAQDV
jgi:hypothetical protein